MPETVLKGCRPNTLMSYLKALGVLRLVAEQKDSAARAAWQKGVFVLYSSLDKEQLVSFFQNEYRPTPAVVPWSGSDFFSINAQGDKGPFDKAPTGSTAIGAFLATTSDRLSIYRETLKGILRVMERTGLRKKSDIEGKSKRGVKADFLSQLRTALPDAAVPWIDAATAIESDRLHFNPLLGSGGGSDGNTHFSDNFMQNLWDCLPDFDHQRQGAGANAQPFSSDKALRNALFADFSSDLVPKRTASLFDGGAVGGPNASQGMERDSLTNPWDFVLAIEGTLSLAGVIARRQAVAGRGTAAFPFSVRMIPVGYGTPVAKESGQNEIWLPLWERPARFNEVSFLFSEGRAEVGRRTAANGAEFARAVAGLGVDAGISEFARYGIVKGRVGGQNYSTGIMLGRFGVYRNPDVSLLQSLDPWLDPFRRACGGKGVPPRFPAALRRLDAAVFDFCRYGGSSRFAETLCALGNIERELSHIREKAGQIGGQSTGPVPKLSLKWITASDDGTVEFRIALSLASILGDRDVGPLRANLEPVQADGKGVRWAGSNRTVVWSSADLCRNLGSVLERRVMDAGRFSLKELPLNGKLHADRADIATFLEGWTDDARIAELLWGAILIDQNRPWPVPKPPPAQLTTLPHTYALLKLLFVSGPSALRTASGGRPLRPEPELLGRLRARDIIGACEIAARRLRASGFVPLPGPVSGGFWRAPEVDDRIDPLRLLAAMLIPIGHSDYLRRLALRESKEPTRTAQE